MPHHAAARGVGCHAAGLELVVLLVKGVGAQVGVLHVPRAVVAHRSHRPFLRVVRRPHHRRVHLIHRQVVHHLARAHGWRAGRGAGQGPRQGSGAGSAAPEGRPPSSSRALAIQHARQPPYTRAPCRCSASLMGTAWPATSCMPAVSTAGAALTPLSDSSLGCCPSPDEAGSSPLQAGRRRRRR